LRLSSLLITAHKWRNKSFLTIATKPIGINDINQTIVIYFGESFFLYLIVNVRYANRSIQTNSHNTDVFEYE